MDDKSEDTVSLSVPVSQDDSALLKKEAGLTPFPPPGLTVSRPASVAPSTTTTTTGGGGRPKLNTIHSSDASRFMTLERLQQNMTLKSPGNNKKDSSQEQQQPQQQQPSQPPPQQQNQERQLTIETAVFPEQQPMFSHNEKTRRHGGSGSQSDTKSVRSGSESTRAPNQNNKRHRRRLHKSMIKPTEIFAQNLSDAVLDANDSDEQEAFVYRDHNSLYPTLPDSFQWSANHDYKRHTDGDSYYTKPRRPVLRSAVSELPPTAMLRASAPSFRPPSSQPSTPPQQYPGSNYNSLNNNSNSSNKRHQHHYYQLKQQHDWYPSDADEEAAPLLLPRYSSPNSKRKRRQGGGAFYNSSSSSNNYNKSKSGLYSNYYSSNGKTRRRKKIILWALFSTCVALTTMWFMLVFTALPLATVEVLELSNVLGSAKELFFDLNVRARNTNFWSIEISHASFSVFASSHYVPTTATSLTAVNNASSAATMAAPVEFLGTIYELDEPLVFQPARFFKPSVSIASSQIQIKNPGKTKGDSSGNERWSLLIRYPYELTVRGVLKYRVIPLIPWAQMHSARVCQVSRVDPATGDISNIPEAEKSICDDPSPIEVTTRIIYPASM